MTRCDLGLQGKIRIAWEWCCVPFSVSKQLCVLTEQQHICNVRYLRT